MWYTVTFVESSDIAAGINQIRMETATTRPVRKTAFQSGVLRYRLAT